MPFDPTTASVGFDPASAKPVAGFDPSSAQPYDPYEHLRQQYPGHDDEWYRGAKEGGVIPEADNGGIMGTLKRVAKTIEGSFGEAAQSGFGNFVARNIDKATGYAGTPWSTENLNKANGGVPQDPAITRRIQESYERAATQSQRAKYGNEVAANSQGFSPAGFVGGVAGSADPSWFINPGEGVVKNIAAKGAERLAAKVAINTGAHAIMGSGDDAAYQIADQVDKLSDHFDIKRNLQAAAFNAAFGAVHPIVSDYVTDLFQKRGVDTTPADDPRGTNSPTTGDQPTLSPEDHAQYQELLNSGSVQEIKAFFQDKQGPKPSWDQVNQWVKYRDAVPEGYAQEEFKPQFDLEREAQKQGLQNQIAEQTKDWKNAPDINVVHSDEAMAGSSPELAKAASDPDALGVYDSNSGKVHIFADRIDSPEVLHSVLYHEALGHYGLAEKFGTSLDKTLQTLMDRNVGKFNDTVDQWQKDNPGAYGGDRVRAAEEVLAEQSQNGQVKPSWTDALSAQVRRYGRRMGLDLSYSDNDIQYILAMAHQAVVDGKGRDVVGNGFKMGSSAKPDYRATDFGLNAEQPDINRYMRKEKNPDDESHILYHGSGNPGIEDFTTDNLRHRTGTEGTLSFTTDPEYAKTYGPNVYKAEVSGKFGDYNNPEHREMVFNWRDKSPLQQGIYRRILEHYKDDPEEGQVAVEAAQDKLRNDIRDGYYSTWENKKLWSDLGWHGAFTKEGGVRNLIVGENAVAKKLGDTSDNRFMKRSQLAAATDYTVKSLKETYDSLDKDYEPAARNWDETRRAALEAGFKPSQIKDLADVKELDKRMYRMGAAAHQLDMKIDDLNKKLDTPRWSMQDKADYIEAVANYHYMLQRIRDNRTEIARALNISKAIGYTKAQMANINEMLSKEGGTLSPLADDETFMRFARQVKDMMDKGNPEGAHSTIESLTKPYWWQYVLSFRQNMMLSGLPTHLKSVMDMATNAARDVEETALSLPIGTVRMMGKGLGLNVKDGVHPTELAGQIWGLIKAATEAKTYKDTLTALKEGFPQDNTNNGNFGAPMPTMPGILGLPTKLVAAQDTFFRAFLHNSNLYRLGARQAYGELKAAGKGKVNWDDVMALGSTYARDPTPEMMGEAKEAANQTILMNKSPINSLIGQAKSVRPDMTWNQQLGSFVMNMLTTFTRIQSNAFLNQVVRRSPVSFFDKVTRDDFAAGGARRDIAITRTLLGTALMISYWNASDPKKDELTGEGPAGASKRAALEASGWRPRAVHENDQYQTNNNLNLSINPFDKHNNVALMVKGLRESYEEGVNKKNVGEGIKLALYSLIHEFTSATFVNQIAPAVDAFTARSQTMGQKLTKFAADEIRTFTPNVAIQAAKTIDPNQHDTSGGLGQAVEANIPGLSQNVPIKYSVYGEPLKTGTTVTGLHSWIGPGNHQTESSDPTIKELSRLEKLVTGTLVSPTQKTIKVYNAPIKLTPQQAEEYQMYAGQTLVQAVREQMQTPDWAKMSEQDKIAFVRGTEKDAKSQVKDALLQKEGWLNEDQLTSLRTQLNGQ